VCDEGFTANTHQAARSIAAESQSSVEAHRCEIGSAETGEA
jgi:hypothetical protein